MINEDELPSDFKAHNNKKQRILEILDKVSNAVKENTSAEELLVMVKLDGEYVRFSSMLESSTETIAILEMLKHDIIKRMSI
tara:strand:+ start:489 stop:734 length:246 start_codon:yes stop_codon:yes gene_type:complete